MSPDNKVRVLIVDDHFIVRQTFRCILKHYPNIEVVGEASDGDEAIACAGRFQPSVVLMDMNMKKMDGITAARLIKTQYPHVLVLGFRPIRRTTMCTRCSKPGRLKCYRKKMP